MACWGQRWCRWGRVHGDVHKMPHGLGRAHRVGLACARKDARGFLLPFSSFPFSLFFPSFPLHFPAGKWAAAAGWLGGWTSEGLWQQLRNCHVKDEDHVTTAAAWSSYNFPRFHSLEESRVLGLGRNLYISPLEVPWFKMFCSMVHRFALLKVIEMRLSTTGI